MSELKRLIDEDADELERALLLSAREDRTPEGASVRALGLLGLAPLAAQTALGTAAGAGATAATGGGAIKGGAVTGLVIAKWLGIGLLAGTVTGGALVAVAPRHAPAAKPPPVRVASPVSIPQSKARPRAVTPPAPATSASAMPVVGVLPPLAPHSEAASPDVSQEIALLDRARQALGRGDAHTALAVLADHDRRFPHGELGLETELVRVEALVQSGKRAQAVRRARALLAQHPHSPYTARIQTLLTQATGGAAPRTNAVSAKPPAPAAAEPSPAASAPAAPPSNVASFPSR